MDAIKEYRTWGRGSDWDGNNLQADLVGTAGMSSYSSLRAKIPCGLW